ncbi:hypothetical protein A244_38450 [Pseudomonas syringae pv. actinidiae ICMP 18807]|uniref:Uncharacterized protein n=1 Tax=Pseudomonas syringae pv. actinidiae ICMP 18807 TaxID=1194404 RepID=S6TXJ2_PSESF|nr:hypothetical protein A244_38450 [Pseudomonas syringae pv. actinidiae ICMP 18807]
MSRLASIWLAMTEMSRPACTVRSRPALAVEPSWVMSLLLCLLSENRLLVTSVAAMVTSRPA